MAKRTKKSGRSNLHSKIRRAATNPSFRKGKVRVGLKEYRSGLEARFAEALNKGDYDYAYEESIFKYIVPETQRKYLSDFSDKVPEGQAPGIVYEIKGRLTSDDRKKMCLLRDQHPNTKFVFVFGRPNNKLKKGSPTTYSSWAEKNGFKWLSIEEVERNPSCILGMTKKPNPGRFPESPKRKKKSS